MKFALCSFHQLTFLFLDKTLTNGRIERFDNFGPGSAPQLIGICSTDRVGGTKNIPIPQFASKLFEIKGISCIALCKTEINIMMTVKEEEFNLADRVEEIVSILSTHLFPHDKPERTPWPQASKKDPVIDFVI